MFTHILTVLGGIVIIAGAALSIWPFLPIEIAYALIAIGVVTVCAGIFSLARNRQKPQTQILPSVQLILRDAHGLTVATGVTTKLPFEGQPRGGSEVFKGAWRPRKCGLAHVQAHITWKEEPKRSHVSVFKNGNEFIRSNGNSVSADVPISSRKDEISFYVTHYNPIPNTVLSDPTRTFASCRLVET